MIDLECLCGARDEQKGPTFQKQACWKCGEPMFPWRGLNARQIWEIAKPIYDAAVARVEKAA